MFDYSNFGIRYFVIQDKIIFSTHKVATRFLTKLTTKYDGRILRTNIIESFKNKTLNLSDKKIYILNRNPIKKISSGLWNYFEYLFRKSSEDLNLTNPDIFYKFIYLTSEPHKPQINYKNNKLVDVFSPIEFLYICNEIIKFLNKNKLKFYEVLYTNPHLNTQQLSIFLLKEKFKSSKYIDLDLLEKSTLVEELEISEHELSQVYLSRTSQKQTSILFDFVLKYLYTKDKDILLNNIYSLYGTKTISIEKEKVFDTADFDLLNYFIDSEMAIYNILNTNKSIF